MRELERDLPTSSATTRLAELSALTILGAGRVGSSLARAARGAGIDAALAGRDDGVAAARDAEVVLLCVPDGELERAARSLAEAGARPRFAGHTSGASALDTLAPLAAIGAGTFSLHPLQTVPDGETDLRACPAAIAGATGEAVALVRALAERLGMVPFEVPEERRAAYHAAAAIASNFLVALEQSATGLLAASLETEDEAQARELLAPLVLRTAANWSERGAQALTGPIARGDEATVERHLEALRGTAPELVPLYEALADRTRELTKERP